MTHVAIHAAAERKRQEEAEEEQMAGYGAEDLEGDWEFKIVRSTTAAFDNPARLQQVIDEEALAGWELLEKFDGYRLRFKRPTSLREQDPLLPPGTDPYRTQIGWGPTAVGLTVAVLAIGAAILLAGLVATSEQAGPSFPRQPFILVAVVVLGLLVFALALFKRRR